MKNKKQETRNKILSVILSFRGICKFTSRTFILVFLVSACSQKPTGNPERFKQGTFYITAGKGYSETLIKRIDSLQIEEYSKKISVSTDSGVFEKEIKRIDTLKIKWKNNFAYTMWMQNPKTDLDKDPIFVQINKVTDTSYSFKARVGYSKFTTDGQVFIKK